MGNGTRTFEAAIERGDRVLGWTIARVPFDPLAVWSERVRLRVKGTINGFPFRTSLFPLSGQQGAYFLLVNREMQAGAKVRQGQVASFRLEPDLDPRSAELPEELDVLLEIRDSLARG